MNLAKKWTVIYIGFQVMLLARLEGAPLSKAYKPYAVEGGATDNAVQKLYLEGYRISLFMLCYYYETDETDCRGGHGWCFPRCV